MSFGGFLSAVGLGAAVMYFMDPNDGGRRRALVRDKARRAVRLAGRGAERTRRSIEDRAKGLVAEATAAADEDVPDDTLEARVRAALGHVCSHPRSIEVVVEAGSVDLDGSILPAERDRVLAEVRAIPGVKEVNDFLDDLQDGSPRPDVHG